MRYEETHILYRINCTNPRGIVVIHSDVFGLNPPNNKLIADSYAKSGEWLVYLPNFFEGDPLALSIADVLRPVNAASQSNLSLFTGILAEAPAFERCVPAKTKRRDT